MLYCELDEIILYSGIHVNGGAKKNSKKNIFELKFLFF